MRRRFMGYTVGEILLFLFTFAIGLGVMVVGIRVIGTKFVFWALFIGVPFAIIIINILGHLFFNEGKGVKGGK